MAEPYRVNYILGSKIQGIPKKYSENFVDYFPTSKNGMTESVGTQFHYTFKAFSLNCSAGY